MSPVESILEAQTTSLLRRLSREEETRVRKVRTEAAEQSREILLRARTEARTRVRQAIVDARREVDAALASRRAALDTRDRRAEQASLRQFLDDAWRRLPDALQARWNEPQARDEWCVAACRQSARVLRATDRLRVEVDADDVRTVAPLIQRQLQALGIPAAKVEPVIGLGAGLRLWGGDACVDATLPGLLAARDRVAAELLAEYAAPEQRNGRELAA